MSITQRHLWALNLFTELMLRVTKLYKRAQDNAQRMNVARAVNEIICKSSEFANVSTLYERILFPFFADALSAARDVNFSDLSRNLVAALCNFSKAVSELLPCLRVFVLFPPSNHGLCIWRCFFAFCPFCNNFEPCSSFQLKVQFWVKLKVPLGGLTLNVGTQGWGVSLKSTEATPCGHFSK